MPTTTRLSSPRPTSHLAPASDASAASEAVVEVGWILAGKLDEADHKAAYRARQQVLDYLQQRFPQFSWRMPLLERGELVRNLLIEPVVLLDHAVTERNIKHWDYSIVVTSADLISHYKQDAYAVVSRSLEGAVISTSRIDPQAVRAEADRECRVKMMAQRIQTLALHALGHLNGLGHHEQVGNYMYDMQTLEDLDGADHYCDEQVSELVDDLQQTADRRLEERPSFRGARRFTFYLISTWLNRDEILNAIWLARPWQFPYRLSRLTTAAVSAMLVLMITAEAWDLGMSQSGTLLTAFSLGAIFITTAYVLVRQRLLMRRDRKMLSEQIVVTNVSTTAIVLSGMITTYSWLLLFTLLLGWVLFSPALIEQWATSLAGEVHAYHYLRLAAFVASLGICIGALGASFEQQHYFRHITFVDEEL